MSSAAWRRAPCTNTPASVSGGLPTATLAISVAVSMASQGPLVISTPPQRGRRNVERGTDRAVVGPVCEPRESSAPHMFRVPCSAFRVREPSPATSPYLLQLSDVGLIAVSQPKVPIERRRPWARPLRPCDEHDGALARHVLKPDIPGLVGQLEAITIDVIDRSGPRFVVMHQRIGRAGRRRR